MNLFKSDVLSKYSDYNKEKLFDFIYKTPFEYRTTLSIDKDVKFGTEIEFIVNALKREKMYKYIHNNTDYNIHIESVCNHCDINFLPLEISTSILTNNKDKLLELKSIFDYLYEKSL